MPENSPNTSVAYAVAIESTSTVIAAANSLRKGLTVVNIGDVDVYVAFGVDAVALAGGTLLASGGTLNLNWTNMNYGQVNGIVAEYTGSEVGSEVGDGLVTVLEW